MDKRVFLVDDVAGTQALLRELFAALGGLALVGTAASEGEARFWLEENPDAWDLAVVDLILEAGSGMGVISRCRQVNPTGVIVVFSGYATPAIVRHCTGLGASAVFPKQRPADFVQWVQQHTRR